MAKEVKLGPGQQFGQWTLRGNEHLGKGGNGVVWEAENAAGVGSIFSIFLAAQPAEVEAPVAIREVAS